MLSKADPRTKLAVVSSFSTMAVISCGIFPLSVVFLATLVAMLMFGCKLSVVYEKLRGFFAVIIFMALVQSIFTRTGETLLQVFGITIITTGGLNSALEFLLRMLIITCSATILATSSGRDIIEGLVQLKVPYEIAFMSMIGIKFIPALKEQFKDVITAMQLRGIDFSKATLKEKYQLISHMFTPVVAGAIINSRQVAISAQLRGFRAYPTRTSHYTLHFSKKDTFVVVLTAMFTLLFIAWQVYFY